MIPRYYEKKDVVHKSVLAGVNAKTNEKTRVVIQDSALIFGQLTFCQLHQAALEQKPIKYKGLLRQ